MFNELSLQIEKHLVQGSDFAIAQVIDRIAPSSGKVGDKALILDTGELIGWIGGGCVRGIVVKEALDVIKNKRYRRVRISPEGGSRETENYKEYVMSCQSRLSHMGDCEALCVKVDPLNCLLRFFEDHFIYYHQWFHIFPDLFVESMLYVMNFISW